MYKFSTRNIRRPNQTEIPETAYHVKFKIEVPYKRYSKEIKLSCIINYTFTNLASFGVFHK